MNPSGINDSTLSSPEQPWQSLSYWGLLPIVLQSLKLLAQQYWLLVPVFILRDLWLEYLWVLLSAVAVLLLLVMTVVWLQFRRYRFRLQSDRVELHYGLFKRVQLDLPFDRIQNVVLKQPWYFRLSQQYHVGLDTAGSDEQEVGILALPLERAQQLRQQVLRHKQRQQNQQSPQVAEGQEHSLSEQDTAASPWLCLSPSALLLHGLLKQRAWLLLLSVLVFWPLVETWFIDQLDAVMDLEELTNGKLSGLKELGELEELTYDQLAITVEQFGFWLTLLFFALPIVLLVLLMSGLSALYALLRWYDLRFGLQGQDYWLSYGSISRQQTSLPQARLIYASLKQGLLQQWFGRVDLQLRQISVGYGDKQLQVPALTWPQAQEVVQRIYAQHLWPQQWMAVSKRMMILPLVLCSLMLLPAVAWLFWQDSPVWAALLGAGYLLCLMMIWLRWRRTGYCVDEHFLYLRSGMLGWQYQLVPWSSIQAQSWSANWLQLRRGLGSLYLQSAAGWLTLPFISQAEAQLLFARSIEQTRAANPEWW